jgi:hypothetical protein
MTPSTTTGSAERLQRAAGAWRMEFEQLVYNAPAILRPRRFSVLGEHAILQQLREFTGHEPLAKDAERLFARGALPDGTYIARNGRWLPEMRPEAVIPEPEPEPEPKPEQLASGQVKELHDRIASLENTVRALQKMLETTMRAMSELASQPRAAAAPAAPATAYEARGAAEPAGAPQMNVPSIRPAPPAPRPLVDPNEKMISLPTVAALSDLVKSLAGPDAVLQPADRANWAELAAKGPVYAAAINNHDGHDVGAMILDIESALRLAGALLMESDDMITSLLEEKMMSDEMLDAASEVCNTLMSAFNKISGNPHLRVSKLSLLDGAGAAWIGAARKVDDYRYSHGGRLAMALR